MTVQEFVQLCSAAQTARRFEDVRTRLEQLVTALDEGRAFPELAEFQREVYKSRARQSLELLARRQKDPDQLAPALAAWLAAPTPWTDGPLGVWLAAGGHHIGRWFLDSAYPKNESARLSDAELRGKLDGLFAPAPAGPPLPELKTWLLDAVSFNDWFLKAAYFSDAAVRGDTLAAGLRDQFRTLLDRVPGFDTALRLDQIQEKKSLLRMKMFAGTSVVPEQTLASAAGLESILTSLPGPPPSGPLGELAAIKTTARGRLATPIAVLLDSALAEYKAEIGAVGEGRLDQDPSFVLQKNLNSARAKVEAHPDLIDDPRAAYLARLDDLDEAFDAVRYMSSTAVYKAYFEPDLEATALEIERTADFNAVSTHLGDVERWSGEGVDGVNKLAGHHRNLVRGRVRELRQQLDARWTDAEAHAREVQLVGEALAATTARPTLSKVVIEGLLTRFGLAMRWGAALLNDAPPGDARVAATARLETLRGGERRAKDLFREMPARYQAHVARLSAVAAALAADVPAAPDLRPVVGDLAELQQSVRESDPPLHPADFGPLDATLRDAQKRLDARLNDAADARRELDRLDARLDDAAAQLRWRLDDAALEADARRVGFRVFRGRFALADREDLGGRVRKAFARIAGLRRRRAQIVAERAANEQALFADLGQLVADCLAQVRAHPGDQGSWEAAITADRELRDAPLPPEKREELRIRLQPAFDLVRAERARFAQRAAVVFGQYQDQINNILATLEQPSPARADAFAAIEDVKPLRERLRGETALLRGHRDELFAALRVVSEAIGEVLDKSSAEMGRQLIHIRRRVDELAALVGRVATPADVRAAMAAHKVLAAESRGAELALTGRAEVRDRMEDVWNLIMEKKRQVGEGRFDPAFIDATLARLEEQGLFLWLDAAPPRIA